MSSPPRPFLLPSHVRPIRYAIELTPTFEGDFAFYGSQPSLAPLPPTHHGLPQLLYFLLIL